MNRKIYMSMTNLLLTPENIASKIFLVRGQKVLIDQDLAMLYALPTARLNEQVKRNKNRFPADFMFQLSKQEYENLISQFATSSWGGRRKLPYVFTEYGAIMLASVLNSKVAVEASIQVVRAFVKLREIISSHKEIEAKIELLESKFDKHDDEIQTLFEAIKQMLSPSNRPMKKIGFKRDDVE
jgi:hypothetical protein